MEARLVLKNAIQEWLDVFKRNSVKPTTFDRLLVTKSLMDKYSISRMYLDEITTLDIQQYLNRLIADGYSKSTVKKQYTLLTAYMKHAISQGLMQRAVYLSVSLPKDECRSEKIPETYNEFEQRKLMQKLVTLEKTPYGAIILMLEAGLRIGEAQALTWDDILWNRKAIFIRKTVVRLGKEHGLSYVQNSPKSDSSVRTVPLSNTAIDILERLYANRTSNYIFPSAKDSSTPISYDCVRFHIQTACKDAGVPYRGTHAFRHTFATNCYNRGCDVKILSKLLGHADVGITYNTYIHLYGDALEEMRKVIG